MAENVSNEIGYNIDYSNWQINSLTTVRDSFDLIINKRGKFYLYDEMVRNDSLIGGYNNLVESFATSEDFIVNASEYDTDEKYKKFVESVFSDMEDTFQSYMKDWLTFTVYGFSLAEIVPKKRLGNNPNNPKKHSKFNDGLIGLRKLASRHQKTIENWAYDKYGRIEYVEQSDPNNYSNKTQIPYNKLMHFRIKSYNGNPEGQSVFRNCALAYYAKKNIMREQQIRFERGFDGIPVLYAPAEWMDTTNPKYAKFRSAIEDMVKNVRTGQSSGMTLATIPAMNMQNKRALEFEIVSGAASGKEDAEKMIDRCDNYINTSLLSDFFLGSSGASISGSLGQLKISIFANFITLILNVIKDELNKKLLPMLWELNGFDVKYMPTITHTNMSKMNKMELMLFLQSIGKTKLLTPTLETENSIRKLLGGGILPSITQEEFDKQQLMNEVNYVDNLDNATVDEPSFEQTDKTSE